jgi:DNA-binding MarR family transcriptional regulator
MIKRNYFDLFMSASRINKLFLDFLKSELDKMNINDINGTQAVVLYNIGTSKISVGDIISKGYYVGSNVSYNLKKMIESDYITQEISEHDKRLIHIKLTDKGLNLYNLIQDRISSGDANTVDSILKKMSSFEKTLSSLNERNC